MMLYKNTKVKVRFSDGDTDYYDIVTGVLQGDTLASYLFLFSLDYVFRSSIDLMKENVFRSSIDLMKENVFRSSIDLMKENVFRSSIDLMKENGFKRVKKKKTEDTQQKTITDADYDDDITLLANTLAQANSLLHYLEEEPDGICLHVNVDKTEYMCLKSKRRHLHT